MHLKGKCLSNIWPQESLSHGTGDYRQAGILSPWSFKFSLVLLWVQKEPLVLQGQRSSKDLLFLEMSGQKLVSDFGRETVDMGEQLQHFSTRGKYRVPQEEKQSPHLSEVTQKARKLFF